MNPDIWINRAFAIEQFDGKGMTVAQVANASGLNILTVKRYAKKFGFAFEGCRKNRAGTEEIVDRIKALAEKGMTRSQVAETLGMRVAVVGNLARNHSIEFVHASVGRGCDATRTDAMAAMYKGGKTLAEIGEVYGVTRERVRQILSRYAGVSAVEGGQSVRSSRKKRSAQSKKDAASLEKYGCTYAQYRDLVRIGLESKQSNEKTNATTPTGAFHSQRQNALRRGIKWKLSLWDWWQVWQESGKWAERGRGRGSYVMCRFGDAGAYEVGSVYIAKFEHNVSFQPNNPYRKGHPDHEKAVASLRKRAQSRGRKRRASKYDLPLGVTFHKNRYIAQISILGKNKYIGSFDTAELAHTAYLAAASEAYIAVEKEAA